MGRSPYCPFCHPETTVYYQDETIAIIQDKYRPGKLIITREHYPMTREALDEVFEIHAGTWHVSVDHMHIYYEALELPAVETIEGETAVEWPSSLELGERCDVLRRSLESMSRLWLQAALGRDAGEGMAIQVWQRWGQTLGRFHKADLPLRSRNVRAALTSLYTLAGALGWGTAMVGKMSSEHEGLLKWEQCQRWQAERSPAGLRVPCERLDEAFCQGFIQEFNPQIEATFIRAASDEEDCCQMILRWKDRNFHF